MNVLLHMSSMETISVIYCFPRLAEVGGALVDIILFLEILSRKLLLVFKLTTVLLLKTSVSLKRDPVRVQYTA